MDVNGKEYGYGNEESLLLSISAETLCSSRKTEFAERPLSEYVLSK